MKLPKKPLKKTFLKQKKLLPWFKTDEQDLDKIMAREIDFKAATKKQMRDALVTLEQTIKAQQRTIYNVCEEGRWQRNYLRILIIEARGYAKKFNKDFEKQEAKHDALVFILRNKIEKLEATCGEWYDRDQEWKKITKKREKEYIKAKNMWEKVHKDILEKNTDCIKKNREIVKDHAEVTRAYNGLHMFGKFAEEEGIDIKKHQKQLPENNTEFEQEHKLLESGKVQHSYKFKVSPKKKN
tara:strand:+ start:133 stop:852 length:720 start_codon:yes stop_codon:yes gene_type:complete